MPSSLGEIQELLDEQAINEVVYRYGRCMDRLDRARPDHVLARGDGRLPRAEFPGSGYGFIDMCMVAHPNFHSSYFPEEG